MNCRSCNKQLTNPRQVAKGIGPECERREKGIMNGSIKPRVTLIGQETRNYDRPVPTRQYIWSIGKQKMIVTVFVDDIKNNLKSANCGCGSNGKCQHIIPVIEYEKRFYPNQISH